MSLGSKIKAFGLKNFTSLGEFARALDMSLPNLSAYIHETRMPGSPFLAKMLALGCDLNWLFSDDKTNDATPVNNALTYERRIKQLESEINRLKEKLKSIEQLTKNK
jgi:transcriptional regulator with XRE-family HTH domain